MIMNIAFADSRKIAFDASGGTPRSLSVPRGDLSGVIAEKLRKCVDLLTTLGVEI